jgi:hypothetical protein
MGWSSTVAQAATIVAIKRLSNGSFIGRARFNANELKLSHGSGERKACSPWRVAVLSGTLAMLNIRGNDAV